MVIVKKAQNKVTKKLTKSDSLDAPTDVELILSFINQETNSQSKQISKSKKYIQLPKAYKFLDSTDKDKIVRYTAELIRKNYFKNIDFKSQLYKFAFLFGSEKDWGHINMFLESILIGSINIDFVNKICKSIFTIIDDEYSKDIPSSSILATSLALITEIGAKAKLEADKESGANKFKILYFIDYLTSNMIARSNINNETIRVGLVYYFSRVEPLSHINIQKILSRFGQSLLEHVLQTYFCNNKKSDLAFYFIVEHLDEFIFSTPGLAEMSNSVLQNQMLKHPEEFPLLIKKYISFKMKNLSYMNANSFIIHLSFLLREACEINQKTLIDSMLEVTFSFIYLFEGKSRETMINLYEVLGEIISSSKSSKAKEISTIIYDKILASKKFVDANDACKLIHIDLKSSHVYNKLKQQLDSAKKPSPLEEILLLAG
jgi:hypothetical protein